MNQRVIWVGSAPTPELAVPCRTCNVTIGEPCDGRVHPLPHRARAEYAEVLGFRAVAGPGPLFTGDCGQ